MAKSVIASSESYRGYRFHNGNVFSQNRISLLKIPLKKTANQPFKINIRKTVIMKCISHLVSARNVYKMETTLIELYGLCMAIDGNQSTGLLL